MNTPFKNKNREKNTASAATGAESIWRSPAAKTSFFKKLAKPAAIIVGSIILGTGTYFATTSFVNKLERIENNAVGANTGVIDANKKLDDYKLVMEKLVEYAKMTNDNTRVNLEISQKGEFIIHVKERKKVGGFLGIGSKYEEVDKVVEKIDLSFKNNQTVNAVRENKIQLKKIEILKPKGIEDGSFRQQIKEEIENDKKRAGIH